MQELFQMKEEAPERGDERWREERNSSLCATTILRLKIVVLSNFCEQESVFYMNGKIKWKMGL